MTCDKLKILVGVCTLCSCYCHHVTLKGQGRDPEIFGVSYLEYGWRYRLGYNRAPIGNGTWRIEWSRDRRRHVTSSGEDRDFAMFRRKIGYVEKSDGIGQTPCSCEHYLVTIVSIVDSRLEIVIPGMWNPRCLTLTVWTPSSFGTNLMAYWPGLTSLISQSSVSPDGLVTLAAKSFNSASATTAHHDRVYQSHHTRRGWYVGLLLSCWSWRALTERRWPTAELLKKMSTKKHFFWGEHALREENGFIGESNCGQHTRRKRIARFTYLLTYLHTSRLHPPFVICCYSTP